MDRTKTIEFQGEQYFDDRMFVLYLCRGKVQLEPDADGAVWTTIYHEKAPEDHIWCVVTYRNCNSYPLLRVDSFYRREAAENYIESIEPGTPLISLDGFSPKKPLSFEKYSDWKVEANLKDYDWESLYSVDGINASERVRQTKKQFYGIK